LEPPPEAVLLELARGCRKGMWKGNGEGGEGQGREGREEGGRHKKKEVREGGGRRKEGRGGKEVEGKNDFIDFFQKMSNLRISDLFFILKLPSTSPSPPTTGIFFPPGARAIYILPI
jgi:hypothetical protein